MLLSIVVVELVDVSLYMHDGIDVIRNSYVLQVILRKMECTPTV